MSVRFNLMISRLDGRSNIGLEMKRFATKRKPPNASPEKKAISRTNPANEKTASIMLPAFSPGGGTYSFHVRFASYPIRLSRLSVAAKLGASITNATKLPFRSMNTVLPLALSVSKGRD